MNTTQKLDWTSKYTGIYIYIIYIDGTYITNIERIWYLQTTVSFEELGRWRGDHSVWLTGMGTGCRSLEDLGIFRETRLKTHKSNTQNKCMDYDSGWWFQTWILFSIMYIYIIIYIYTYGMSSFPLTFIFFKMVKTANQDSILET